MGLLDLGYLLCLLQVSVGTCLHVLVSVQGSLHDVCHGTLLLVAELVGLGEVVGVESCLDVCNELRKRALAESGLQCQPALDGHSKHGEQEGVDDRNDNAALEDGTPYVSRCLVGTRILEVHVVAEPCEEQYERNDGANDDDPECTSNSCEALGLFLRGCFLLCSCHNLMKFLILGY